MKYRETYENGKRILSDSGIENADIDARLLLEYICHTDRSYLYAHGDDELTDMQQQMYQMLIDKRSSRVPLQHITGEQDFMGMTFRVNENVLIPRQDTEVLVEEAMLVTEDGAKLLDMCTGSGCVLISVARYKNDLYTVGADISEKALAVAKSNADRLLNIENANNPVFIQTDLFDKIDEKFDVITSNPPYIESEVINSLEAEVKNYDPMLALDGGEDGLVIIRKLITESRNYLNNGGYLLFEIGYNQGEICKDLMLRAGYSDVEIIKDLAGLDRVVKGRYCK